MRRGVTRLLRLPGKGVYVLYYRAVFGRSFPQSMRVQRAIERLETSLGHGDTPAPRDVWEEKYRAGRWAYMRDLHELPRYAAVAALTHRLAGDGRILDVGCGEGLLVDQLRAYGYESYLGIDISSDAIESARAARGDERTRFEAWDAEKFEPVGQFGAIVFNECLCYFHDPLAATVRYCSFLAPGGRFVVSTFSTPRHDAIVRLLAQRYEVLEEFSVHNRLGSSRLRVLEPVL